MAQLSFPQARPQEIVFLSAAARTTTATSSAVNLPDSCQAIMFISDMNTVTGTSPTLDVSIEITHDDGTTWFGVSRFTQQTAASERFLIQPLMGKNVVGTEGVTEANWEFAEAAATGGALVQSCVTSRKIRVVATIGGTNPSFNGSVVAIVHAFK